VLGPPRHGGSASEVADDSSPGNSAAGRRQLRIVCLQRSTAEPLDQQWQQELLRLAQHAALALHSVTRTASLRSRLWAKLCCADGEPLHRVGLGLAAALLVAAAAIFPIPLRVQAPAVVRPAQSITLCAPREAIVKQIHVRHGQRVAPEQRLLTLVDPSLEQQITTLAGRRAVLVEQQSRFTETLVETSSNHVDRLEQAESQRSLVAEEIRSVDEQLSVLRRVRQSLVIRADREGIVDAWQIESRLHWRPMARGDELLSVISLDSPWQVEARVPQNRIAHLQVAQDNRSPRQILARVALDADPRQAFDAVIAQIGPTVSTPQDPALANAVTLRLSEQANAEISTQGRAGKVSGAPARVVFHCGKSPAAYVLFQDLVRAIRANVGLYCTPTDFHSTGES